VWLHLSPGWALPAGPRSGVPASWRRCALRPVAGNPDRVTHDATWSNS